MKKLIALFSLIIVAGCSRAQTNDSVGAPMPAYKILKTDSVYATPADLKHQKTVLVYFSPDCPHCQHLIMDMKQQMKKLSDTQIIMITWSNNFDIRAIKNFVKDYDLKKFPNLVIGTEGYTYMVQRFYKIQTTPFVAVFNSDKKLVKTLSKLPEIDDIIKAVKLADSKKARS